MWLILGNRIYHIDNANLILAVVPPSRLLGLEAIESKRVKEGKRGSKEVRERWWYFFSLGRVFLGKRADKLLPGTTSTSGGDPVRDMAPGAIQHWAFIHPRHGGWEKMAAPPFGDGGAICSAGLRQGLGVVPAGHSSCARGEKTWRIDPGHTLSQASILLWPS